MSSVERIMSELNRTECQPCTQCKCTSLVMTYPSTAEFAVRCIACESSGPHRPTRTLAIDGWNDLWERQQEKEKGVKPLLAQCKDCNSYDVTTLEGPPFTVKCNRCGNFIKSIHREAAIREWNKPSAERVVTSAVSPETDKVPVSPINPGHYRSHPSGVECIEITRHMNFNIGNAIKYLWRHGQKANAVEDLKKARWYLDDEIKRLEAMPDKSRSIER